MKLKIDDAGNVVVSDGKPVYLADDGKEVVFDYAGTLATIARLNGEARNHRTAKEAAETKLASFEGIGDPDAAKKALGIVANLDAKKLVDAGQVETVRAEAIKATELKFAPIVEENGRLKGDLYSEKIGGSFARSKFITDKIAIPSDLMQARFGQNFEIKDGKIVAKDSSGNPIYSRSKPGEVADFEEAIESLVDQYAQKDAILKGNGNNGDGKQRNQNQNNNGARKTIPKSEFDALPPAQRAAKMADGFSLTE